MDRCCDQAIGGTIRFVDLVHGFPMETARRRIHFTASARDALRMSGLGIPILFADESDPARVVPEVAHAPDRAVEAKGIAPARLYDPRPTWATRAAMSGIELKGAITLGVPTNTPTQGVGWIQPGVAWLEDWRRG